jgi:hypothetical protein
MFLLQKEMKNKADIFSFQNKMRNRSVFIWSVSLAIIKPAITRG